MEENVSDQLDDGVRSADNIVSDERAEEHFAASEETTELRDDRMLSDVDNESTKSLNDMKSL